ncbi:MAG: hypothetical protein U0793_16350 [Gemmataceae bacterium]
MTDQEADELRRRRARLEAICESVAFSQTLWGRLLRLISVACIAFVVMLLGLPLASAIVRSFR